MLREKPLKELKINLKHEEMCTALKERLSLGY